MADVMHQRKRLGKIFVQAKSGGCGTGYLRDLNGVGETAAKVIRGAAGKYLRLACEPPEGAGLHDAFTVTLKGCARGAEGRGIDARQKNIVRISGDRAPMEIDCHSQF
jgi:hypothetical protein